MPYLESVLGIGKVWTNLPGKQPVSAKEGLVLPPGSGVPAAPGDHRSPFQRPPNARLETESGLMMPSFLFLLVMVELMNVLALDRFIPR